MLDVHHLILFTATPCANTHCTDTAQAHSCVRAHMREHAGQLCAVQCCDCTLACLWHNRHNRTTDHNSSTTVLHCSASARMHARLLIPAHNRQHLTTPQLCAEVTVHSLMRTQHTPQKKLHGMAVHVLCAAVTALSHACLSAPAHNRLHLSHKISRARTHPCCAAATTAAPPAAATAAAAHMQTLLSSSPLMCM